MWTYTSRHLLAVTFYFASVACQFVYRHGDFDYGFNNPEERSDSFHIERGRGFTYEHPPIIRERHDEIPKIYYTSDNRRFGYTSSPFVRNTGYVNGREYESPKPFVRTTSDGNGREYESPNPFVRTTGYVNGREYESPNPFVRTTSDGNGREYESPNPFVRTTGYVNGREYESPNLSMRTTSDGNEREFESPNPFVRTKSDGNGREYESPNPFVRTTSDGNGREYESPNPFVRTTSDGNGREYESPNPFVRTTGYVNGREYESPNPFVRTTSDGNGREYESPNPFVRTTGYVNGREYESPNLSMRTTSDGNEREFESPNPFVRTKSDGNGREYESPNPFVRTTSDGNGREYESPNPFVRTTSDGNGREYESPNPFVRTTSDGNRSEYESRNPVTDDSRRKEMDVERKQPDHIPESPNDGSIGLGASYTQRFLADLIGQSPAYNYVPRSAVDFFDFLRDTYPLPKGFRAPLAEYDYVIVGAGSAGSALASRLTEDKPRATVLLLEAGKPEMLLTDMPAIAPYFQNTDYAWQYMMEQQPGVCMGMEQQRCFWPRGKAVGGTSVINYMIYTRGRPQEWDRIAADGNYGWSYSDVLKYYIKSEKCTLRRYKDLPYRGRDGKVSVEDVSFRTRLVGAFLEAGRILGHETVDYNAPNSFGFGYLQANTINGHRHSSAKAYLHPHKRRPNLHILPEAFVTKVLIEPQTKRAYGVKYVRNRLKYTVKARREVILSAGPIASPQLLMLSGVGPKEHLRSLNIPVIQNLNVGQTLYDHITFPGVVFRLNTTNVSLQEGKLTEIMNFSPAVSQWFQFGDGPAVSPGGVEGIGYIKTSVSDDPELVPDIELISLGGSIASDAGGGGSQGIRRGMRITDEVFNSAFGPLFARDTWSAFPMLLHPKSKGRLELRDANPFSFPKMYGNYLTDQRDVATFVAAIRYIIALGETEPFRKFGATLHEADIPMCRQYRFNSDGYWECAVRTFTATLHHQIATCKMGPATDKDAVVDPELRVHGIRGLRVVDTSIIPRTTAAHTNAPGMMIGEKAADLIKQTWQSRKRL